MKHNFDILKSVPSMINLILILDLILLHSLGLQACPTWERGNVKKIDIKKVCNLRKEEPEYLTHSHGAAGIAQLFYGHFIIELDRERLAHVDTANQEIWEGALTWLSAMAIIESDGIKWPMSNLNSTIYSIVPLYIASVFYPGYQTTGNQAYLDCAQGGWN
jgi:hypothetical protein